MLDLLRPLLLLAIVLPPTIAAETAKPNDPVAFAEVVSPQAVLRRIETGFEFAEGPAWRPDGDGGCLVFSDIAGTELHHKPRDEDSAEVYVGQRDRRGATNGNAFLPTEAGKPRLVTCAHDLHALLVDADDDVAGFTVLVDSFQGKPLNSPNDLAIAKDGAIWFTDPTYGLGKRTKEQEKNRVYRFTPATKELTAMIDELEQPNGICFSPDGATLYVADSGAAHRVLAWDVAPGPKLQHQREVAVIAPGVPDGMKCDTAGRLYVAAGDGVQVFAEGTLIGRILVPETPANLCFGGADGKTLFITAKTSLYAITLAVVGAR